MMKTSMAWLKKEKKITEIDIAHLNIQFPKEGFFIALEWLIIEANKYEYTYTDRITNQEGILVNYHPSFRVVPTDTNANSWNFSKSYWRKAFLNSSAYSRQYSNKYSIPAIELTLIN